MNFRIIVFCLASACLGLASGVRAQAQTNRSPISNPNTGPQHVESMEEARLRLAQERKPFLSHGLYEDFPAQVATYDIWFPKFLDGVALAESGSRFSGILTNGEASELLSNFKEVATQIPSSNQVFHILARELTAPLIREAVASKHFFVANDWLCNASGFMFGAINNQGVFTMGDLTVMFGKTKVIAVSPVPAKMRLLHEESIIHETTGTNLMFETKEGGVYRVEASLVVNGIDVPWIFSNPVFLKKADFFDLAGALPSTEISSNVSVHANLPYRKGSEEDAPKHKLDIYSPKNKTNAPVFFFVHGGSWKTGDRSQYPSLGNLFAKEGFVTVVPSYRLATKNIKHPTQIEDVAAAFAWAVRHVAEYGGDPQRIYVGGHSAGGHLASLLALDGRYLAAHQLSSKNIRGVLAWSGVYDVSEGENLSAVFGKNLNERKDASPLFHASPGAPPFLVTYCEWDYFSLPAQAKTFYQALNKTGIQAQLVYVPGKSHLSEMLHLTHEGDVTATTALKFMQ